MTDFALSTVVAGLLTAALIGGCTTEPEDGQRPDLDGVLGFAAFTLECDYDACMGTRTVPPFVRGAEFDFTVEISSSVPDADRAATVTMHVGDERFIDGAEVRTVLATSTRSFRLVDYAFVYLYDPDELRLEGTFGDDIELDDDTYLLPLQRPTAVQIVPFRQGSELAGRPPFQARALDSDALDVAVSFDRITLTGRQSGVTQLEITTPGHTEVFELLVSSGPRSNPTTAGPPPPRTNPGSDSDSDGDTDTDTDTDGETDGTTSTGGGSGSSSSTGGMQ